MTDRLRLLELCLKESAATYGWNITGNFLSCNKGYLTFTLMPTLGETDIDYILLFRFTAFDRIFHSLMLNNYYTGFPIMESSQRVTVWSLMGVSAAMRALVSKVDQFAVALAEKVKNLDDNLDFLQYLQQKRAEAEQPEKSITVEAILSQMLMGDYDGAAMSARHAIAGGDRENAPFYRAVISFSEKIQK